MSKAPYRGFVGGRSTGKSYVGALDLIARSKPGRTYLVAAPTYPMLTDSSLRSFLHVARTLGVLDLGKLKKAPPPSCTLKTGAEILFRSADDPERLRGPNLSGAWLDEASLMHKDAFDIVIACLREGGEQGWLSSTFTPKGMDHWTYDYFGTCRPNTELFHAATVDNPFNPPQFSATLAQQYGADTAFARQELGGEFVCDDDAWQVIPRGWVVAAQQRWSDTPPAGQMLSCIGADIAHGGADKTAIAARYGSWFAPIKRYQGTDTDTGEKAALLILREIPAGSDAPVNVDAIGYGASCQEELAKIIGQRSVAINVAEAPTPAEYDRTGKYKLTNIRAAAYWKFREALDPVNGDNLALPPDMELLADLTAARFEVRTSGILIEPKVKIKDRLGRSPDTADAIVLAHYREWQPDMNIHQLRLTPEPAKPPPPPAELKYAGVRYFAPNRSYQPILDKAGEKLYLPDFREEDQAGYAVHVLHRLLEWTAPDFPEPAVEPAVAAEVEQKVREFVRQRRLANI